MTRIEIIDAYNKGMISANECTQLLGMKIENFLYDYEQNHEQIYEQKDKT